MEHLEQGNTLCQKLAKRARSPRATWTWGPIDFSGYASRLQFGGVFTLQETMEIYDSLVRFVGDVLRQDTGAILIVLNQLARRDDPFLQNKSKFFTWEDTVNFFATGADPNIDDVNLCLREKTGHPSVAFVSRAPGIKIADRSELQRPELVELIDGVTHLIISIFDEESYLIEEVAERGTAPE